MGHIREAKGEVLVAGTVPGRASVRDNLQKLSNALHSLTPRRAPPDLPSDRPLQMDGGFGDDADGGRPAVSGVSSGGFDEPSGSPSAAEQNDRGRVPVFDRRCGF